MCKSSYIRKHIHTLTQTYVHKKVVSVRKVELKIFKCHLQSGTPSPVALQSPKKINLETHFSMKQRVFVVSKRHFQEKLKCFFLSPSLWPFLISSVAKHMNFTLPLKLDPKIGAFCICLAGINKKAR